MSGDPQRDKIFCNGCKSVTNHFLKAKHSITDEIPYSDCEPVMIELCVYRMWVCAGCDRVTLEVEVPNWVSEDPKILKRYYPKRRQTRHKPKSFNDIPEKLDRIYKEAVHALNENLHILCAAGLRALIEGICADKGLEGGNLQSKIEGLKAHLPENIVKNVHSFRFIGNDAVHELKPPIAVDLRLAVEVSEDLLNFLYDLDYKAERLALTRHEKERRMKTERAKEHVKTPTETEPER